MTSIRIVDPEEQRTKALLVEIQNTRIILDTKSGQLKEMEKVLALLESTDGEKEVGHSLGDIMVTRKASEMVKILAEKILVTQSTLLTAEKRHDELMRRHQDSMVKDGSVLRNSSGN